MSRLLRTLITFGFAIGLDAAIAQTVEPRTEASGEHKVTKEDCASMRGADRMRCLKAARTTVKESSGPCDKLTDRAKRECMLEEFIRQHDHISGARPIGNIQTLEPAAETQLR
jgi:hypothetical protein